MNIEVPNYEQEQCFTFDWVEGFSIQCHYSECDNEKAVIITANPEGLTSLAKHLLELAQTAVPAGTHMHLDECNALEDGSIELIIERM